MTQTPTVNHKTRSLRVSEMIEVLEIHAPEDGDEELPHRYRRNVLKPERDGGTGSPCSCHLSMGRVM